MNDLIGGRTRTATDWMSTVHIIEIQLNTAWYSERCLSLHSKHITDKQWISETASVKNLKRPQKSAKWKETLWSQNTNTHKKPKAVLTKKKKKPNGIQAIFSASAFSRWFDSFCCLSPFESKAFSSIEAFMAGIGSVMYSLHHLAVANDYYLTVPIHCGFYVRIGRRMELQPHANMTWCTCCNAQFLPPFLSLSLSLTDSLIPSAYV